MSPATAAWFHKVKDAAADVPPRKNTSKPHTKFLAYCIEFRPAGFGSTAKKLHLTLRTGNHIKSGVTIETNSTKADPVAAHQVHDFR